MGGGWEQSPDLVARLEGEAMEKGVPAQEDAHQEVMEEKQGDTELVCPAGSPLMPLAA